jgi:hypothetical protein
MNKEIVVNKAFIRAGKSLGLTESELQKIGGFTMRLNFVRVYRSFKRI